VHNWLYLMILHTLHLHYHDSFCSLYMCFWMNVMPARWLRDVVVRMSDSQLAVVGLKPSHGTASYFWGRWPCLAGKLSLDVTTTHVNSALHPFRVAKLSTSPGCGKGGTVTSAGWQVTLCDPIWYVISCSSEVSLHTAMSCLSFFSVKFCVQLCYWICLQVIFVIACLHLLECRRGKPVSGITYKELDAF